MLGIGLNLVGLVILVAAGFVVLNAFAMSVTQRRRTIGLLRSVGMTRRQVMRLVLVEALLTGGLGTLLGLVGGPLLGRGLVALIGNWANIAYGPGWPSTSNLALAAGLGLSISLLATLFPAWGAARISPLVALRSPNPFPSKKRLRAQTWLSCLGIVGLALYLIATPPGEWTLPPEDFILTGLFGSLWFGCLILILPALIDGVGRGLRPSLSQLSGASGRLIADNLGRGQLRVSLTILGLAVGLMTIVSLSGILTFTFQVTFDQIYHDNQNLERTFFILPIRLGQDWQAISWETISAWDVEAAPIPDPLIAELYATLGQRAEILPGYGTFIPKIAVMPGMPVYVLDGEKLSRLGLFTFYQGDWQSALPLMEAGCGLLLTPRVARFNRAWLGDTINLPGRDGPISCTIAGLGTSTFFGNTIVSVQAGEALGVDMDLPFVFMVQAQADLAADPAARERFKSELQALVAPYPKVSLLDPSTDFDINALLGTFQTMLNGPLLLAMLAAALGVINTTLMSVTERRRELGLLRAVGASRRQVSAVVLGEAALIGLIGGGLGLLSGTGLVIIMVMVMGGNGWGVRALPLWPSAWASIQPGLLNGLVGLVLAPLICAGAAWLPLGSILRPSVITTLYDTSSQIE
jgi:putative ABC transport system permease protein